MTSIAKLREYAAASSPSVTGTELLGLVEIAERFQHAATMWHRRFHPGSFSECANAACANDRDLLDRFDFGNEAAA